MPSSTRSRGRVAALVLLSLALCSPGVHAANKRPTVKASAHSHSVHAEQAPFARVFLALRGCTSCAHCRTSIRQMVRAGSKGGEASLRDDKVEVRYPKPRSVPLRDVIRSLAKNRLHDLSVVDVLFEATGTLAAGENGAKRFVIAGTGQSFPIALGTGIRLPGSGPVRVVALVEGWRTNGVISLVAREVRTAA